MIPWCLSSRQQEVLARTSEFGRAEIAPVADAADRKASIPPGLAQRFHATGLGADLLETKPGDEFVSTACLMAEELAYQCAALASYLMLPIFFNRVVLQHLHGEQREQFLARCLAEPVFTAFAASEAPVRATDAMSWFLLPTDTPGVEIGARWPTFGLRAIDVSPLELDGVIVPVERRLGGEGRGLPMMGSSLSMSRVGIAALGVGIARRARDVVVEHSKRRQIYGAKLNRMQDYRFRIADLEKNIAAARALVWTAAQKLDRGEDALKEASIAKLFSGEMVMNVAGAASAMLGSIGYTGQSPIEKLLRDARHVAIVEGPEPTHKELIFAHLLRHGGY